MAKERDRADLDAEIEAIKELLAVPVRSKDDRLALEANLRPVLTNASNEAIITLRNNRGTRSKYPVEECEKRIEAGEAFGLCDLLQMAEPLGLSGVTGNSNRKLVNLATRGIDSSAPVASHEEVIEAFIEYGETQLDAGTTLLDRILSCRDDFGEIKQAFIERAENESRFYNPEKYIDGVIARAKIIQEKK